MDFDGDGALDVLSGSYDAGEVYVFRSLGKGRFAAAAMLRDATGLPLVHHPVELALHARLLAAGRDRGDDDVVQARVASFGSWPTPVDWDGDGGLDLLVGSLGGEVFLRRSTAAAKQRVFVAESVRLDAGGVPLKVHSHADPFAADWDGDGRWDLVVGAGDGSVGWYRNEGDPKAPRFAPRQDLVVARSATTHLQQTLAPGEVPTPGVRAQIHVGDYDGDGRADLLVGDYRRLTVGARTKPCSFVWWFRRAGPITPR